MAKFLDAQFKSDMSLTSMLRLILIHGFNYGGTEKTTTNGQNESGSSVLKEVFAL